MFRRTFKGRLSAPEKPAAAERLTSMVPPLNRTARSGAYFAQQLRRVGEGG